MDSSSNIVIGIDASNIRAGGGFNHLVELCNAINVSPEQKIEFIIWGSSSLLSCINNSATFEKVAVAELDKNLMRRTFWQIFRLSKQAKVKKCDLLFVPGGSHYGLFAPIVSMHQNLLPFDLKEIWRYRYSTRVLKFLALKLIQSITFYRSKGIIFLSEDSQSKVTGQLPGLRAKSSIIPHGIESRFHQKPKYQKLIEEYSFESPYRILYVSTVDMYKHQWKVVEAVGMLRRQGYPITLDLIGGAYGPALKKLNSAIASNDLAHSWVQYHGPISFKQLHRVYNEADLGVLASTCETFSIVLLEKMAAGLPIACSSKGPFRQMLGDAGTYFEAESASSIAEALKSLVDSPKVRAKKARMSFEASLNYSWELCAAETITFFESVIKSRGIATPKMQDSHV